MVIDVAGELVSDETIAPPPRQRTPDVPPEVQARARYRDNWDAVFGRKLWLAGKTEGSP